MTSQALAGIAEKVTAGERIAREEGIALHREASLLDLSLLADTVRQRLHPERVVTYVVGRNINYTNVCWVKCAFCSFYRLPGHPEGYVLPREEIFQKIDELVALGGTEILIQGGLNPALKIDYYEDLFRAIKGHAPIHIHGLSVAEIRYIAQISHLSLEETLLRLKAAGLDSIPGAGAEMLIEEIRQSVSPLKDTAEEWLFTMETAHRIGLFTTATMVFGFGETAEQRVDHLLKIRSLQDRTDGFTAFIPWGYQPNRDALDGERTTGAEYLKMVALSRILLDNVPNLQASWLTQGPKIGQVSLQYGVNDFGSTVIEENVVTGEGNQFLLPLDEILRLIRDAGYTPRRRNTRYELLD